MTTCSELDELDIVERQRRYKDSETRNEAMAAMLLVNTTQILPNGHWDVPTADHTLRDSDQENQTHC